MFINFKPQFQIPAQKSGIGYVMLLGRVASSSNEDAAKYFR